MRNTPFILYLITLLIPSFTAAITLQELINQQPNGQLNDYLETMVHYHERSVWSGLTILDLSDQQLTDLTGISGLVFTIDEISTPITNLEDLTLIINNNELTCLPAEITQLTNLGTLQLSGNKFSELPDIFNNFNLTLLDISHNNLTALPPSVGNQPMLLELYINNNQISTLPALTLPDLEILNLSNNQLTQLLPDDYNLVNLKNLTAKYNRIQQLPLFFNSPKLSILNVAHNKLRALSELKGLPQLKELYLHHNDLNQTSFSPIFWNRSPDLRLLHLSHNQLTAFPMSLPSSLYILNMSNNYIDSWAESAGYYPHLHYLNLSNNALPCIPESIYQNLPHLSTLILDNNRLNTLPLSLERLSYLKKFSILDNPDMGSTISQITRSTPQLRQFLLCLSRRQKGFFYGSITYQKLLDEFISREIYEFIPTRVPRYEKNGIPKKIKH